MSTTHEKDEWASDWMDRRSAPPRPSDDHVRFTVTLYPQRGNRHLVVSDLSSAVPVSGTVTPRPQRA